MWSLPLSLIRMSGINVKFSHEYNSAAKHYVNQVMKPQNPRCVKGFWVQGCCFEWQNWFTEQNWSERLLYDIWITQGKVSWKFNKKTMCVLWERDGCCFKYSPFSNSHHCAAFLSVNEEMYSFSVQWNNYLLWLFLSLAKSNDDSADVPEFFALLEKRQSQSIPVNVRCVVAPLIH